MSDTYRRKTIEEMRAAGEGKALVRSLSWPHLVALGIGAVVGTGIYVLIGTAAGMAGPAVLLAFLISGIICAAAAFAYAELGTMIPVSGGAYTYAYAACGEVIAWLVGWSMIFGFVLASCFVAVGWSAYCAPYLTALLQNFGTDMPYWLLQPFGSADAVTGETGFVNLPAVAIIALIAGLLLCGTKESVVINAVLVVLKIAALLLFVIIALPSFNMEHFSPFMPHGFFKSVAEDGAERGVMAAAAMVFLAFYGFDAVATAAEETKNPERNLSIGLICSMLSVLVIFIIVCAAALGAMHYTAFAGQGDVLSFILRALHSDTAAILVALVAFIALPTVILAMFYAFTRLLFVLGRDGLLPAGLSRLSKKGTPVIATLIAGLLASVIAGFLPFGQIVSYSSACTLFFYAMVGVALLALRKKEPHAVRGFKTPCAWLVGSAVILGCAYLFFSLPAATHFGFLLWNILGLAVYYIYGRRHSSFAQKSAG